MADYQVRKSFNGMIDIHEVPESKGGDGCCLFSIVKIGFFIFLGWLGLVWIGDLFNEFPENLKIVPFIVKLGFWGSLVTAAISLLALIVMILLGILPDKICPIGASGETLKKTMKTFAISLLICIVFVLIIAWGSW